MRGYVPRLARGIEPVGLRYRCMAQGGPGRATGRSMSSAQAYFGPAALGVVCHSKGNDAVAVIATWKGRACGAILPLSASCEP